MHGLGNDFAILDMRHLPLSITESRETLPELCRFIADRHRGIGCDQIIILEGGEGPFMHIFNADGSEVAACGNATRCVGWLLMHENGVDHAEINTLAGTLSAYSSGGQVRVMMGAPSLTWDKIPLSTEMDTLHLRYGACPDGIAVSMGNPHLVMFVENVEKYPLATVGAELEIAPIFPERANITVATITNPQKITLRTWERGVGETLACGTAACATMVAARRRGFVDATVLLHAPGGSMRIEWEGDEHHPHHNVFMTGPVKYVFHGDIELPL